MFYLVRHGEPDGRERNTGIFQGFGVHLAPLTERGTAQIKETAKDPRLLGTGLILCSPYTRAVQTAAILSRELGADIVVETELHEWLANRNYLYEEDEAAARACAEYREGHGLHTSDSQLWEEAADVRKRVLRVLEAYAAYPKVVVACHGMAIQAVTGGPHPRWGEIVEYSLSLEEKGRGESPA